jgi:DNA-binding MarR family transcriptional regulator
LSRTQSKELRDFQSSPGHLIRRLNQLADVIFQEEAGRFGLTAPQYAVLRVVSVSPGLEQQEVALSCRYDAVTTGGIIRRLEKMNLISREPSGSSKRGLAVTITNDGVEKLASMENALETVQRRLVKNLSADQRDTLINLMKIAAGS